MTALTNLNSRTYLAGLEDLILALGTALFDQSLMATLSRLAKAEHFSLIHMQPDDRVSFITAASIDGVSLPESLQQLYATHYYRFDPNGDYLHAEKLSTTPWIRRLKVTEIEHPDYRRLWYERMGIIDRLSILAYQDRGLYCLNCYRISEPFSDRESALLERAAPLLMSVAIKQTRLSGALAKFQSRDAQMRELGSRLQNLCPGLTPREQEVTTRILLGMTSEGIALDLDIKTQSVLTYRKRAYAKLGICSQNELFSIYLAGPRQHI